MRFQVMYNEEETMKALLGSVVVFAGMTFGVSIANANPVIFPGGCVLFDGNGVLGMATGARTHIVCTPSGNVNAFCKADVTPSKSGTAAHFDFSSTNNFCTIVCPTGPEKTNDWKETVSASGEATLQCKLH
jgi:hypothetical protein